MTLAWNTMGVNQSNLVSESKATLDGRRSWQTVFKNSTSGLTNWSATAWTTNGYRYVTNGAPDGSTSLATYYMGRLTSTVRKDGLGTILSSTTYTYDSHGRQASVVDARSGATTYAYNAADLMASVTTPAPSFAAGPQTTRTWYNKMLQATNVVQPDGSSVFTEYYLTGELKRNYGSRTYPVEYTYDYAGRMKTMTTWKDFESSYGAAVTTWDYDSVRGWLSGKRYNDNSGPVYTYTLGGRLKTRTWARGVVTTYTYGFDDWDNDSTHGDLLSVEYSNDPLMTPAVAYTYDRAGRQSTVTQDATVVTFGYSTAGGLLTETYAGGPLNGLSITNGYDHLLRRTNLTLRSGSAVLSTTAYSYDMASRLSTVSQPSTLNFQPVTATYSYLANTPLVSQILFTNNGVRRMTTTRTYDLANRLLKIESFNAQPSTLSSFNYDYNAANQRTLRREADGSYWRYEYDSLGQVISGKKYWSDGTRVPGQQFEYAFDDIGNRIGTKAGGDANGANLRNADYSANLLNQYTSRTVPGVVDVMGVGFATNTVTINSQATYRKGEYFRKEVSVANSGTPVWQSITVSAAGQTNIVGNSFVVKTPEIFGYDLDGNLTNDGRWAYSWDAENRLVSMVARTSTGPQQRLDFGYDWRGRRIMKKVWNNTSGTGAPSVDRLFAYDGWNLIATLNSSFNIVNSFAWGLDLSGYLQGAGGVGGLLWVNDPSTLNSQPSTHLVSFDGNGNVVGLFNTTDSSETARYEYGPFGEVVRMTGPACGINPFRFSTKCQDDETDLLYYGYRYYNSGTGRWLSRDPADEAAFRRMFPLTLLREQRSEEQGHEYRFCLNEPVQMIDYGGLMVWFPNEDIGEGEPFAKVKGRLVRVTTDRNTKLTAFVPYNRETYNCHGYTFDGYSAPDGPYSIFDKDVLTIIRDDLWVRVCCGMANGGIALFGESKDGWVSHSGKITSVVHQGTKFDEDASQVASKYGPSGALADRSFSSTADMYGDYKCYIRLKDLKLGCCAEPGAHEAGN